MTMDKSLKVHRGLVRSRSVLTRAERIERLKASDRWKEGDDPFGLPKVFDDRRKELAFSGVYRVKDGQVTLVAKDLTGPNGIEGKSLVLHAGGSGPLDAQPGVPNERVACGVIGPIPTLF